MLGEPGSARDPERGTAISNRYARILAVGGAAVLVGALGATAAAPAAKTWTIQPGGAIHAKSARFVLHDTATGTVMTCVPSTGFPLRVRGTLKNGSALPGFHIGSLSAVSFGRCTGPGLPRFARQPGSLPRRIILTLQAGGLPWHVNLFSYNAATGVVRGTIRHLHLILGGSGCSAVIDGTGGTADDGQVAFRYADSTGQLMVLTTSGNLHFYDVMPGCLGLVNDGNRATLSVTYAVSPKQAITSP
jgi:hypothetical protein